MLKDFDKEGFKEWIKTRPESIQKLAKKCPPWYRYRIIPFKICDGTIYSYNEDGTISLIVDKSHEQDFLVPRKVFGLKPSDLMRLR